MTVSFEKTDQELLDYQHDLISYVADQAVEDIQYAKDMEFLDYLDAAIEAGTGKRPRREPRPPRERPEFVPTPTYRFPDVSQI